MLALPLAWTRTELGISRLRWAVCLRFATVSVMFIAVAAADGDDASVAASAAATAFASPKVLLLLLFSFASAADVLLNSLFAFVLTCYLVEKHISQSISERGKFSISTQPR